jgi:hypothetical protein
VNRQRTRRQPVPTPWWVPVVLGLLGLTACILTVAYISWVQVDGRLYWFGLVMMLANLAATVVAAVASGMDARTGRVSWRWWGILGGFMLVSMALFPFMGNFA